MTRSTPNARRVVSLIASATEIVCSLGYGHWLVGRSHECDYPTWVRGLPECSEPKFPVAGSSPQIHQSVQALVEQGLSVYRVKVELLKKLQPDLIVTQTQCEVCAVSEKEVQKALCNWLEHECKIVSLHPMRLADLWTDIKQVASALGDSEAGVKLTESLQKQLQAIARRAQQSASRPRVLCVEWIEPFMICGYWMPELIELAGGEPVAGRPGEHAPRIPLQDVATLEPEVIIVMPCGWNIERTRQDMPLLEQAPCWQNLPAVRHGQVYLADGNQFFNRPGPRLVESLHILAEILHPESFPALHRGTGWGVYP